MYSCNSTALSGGSPSPCVDVIINKSSTFFKFLGLKSSIDLSVTSFPISDKRCSNISASPCALPDSDPYKIVIDLASGSTEGSFSCSIASVLSSKLCCSTESVDVFDC